jgi:hypothetical protein
MIYASKEECYQDILISLTTGLLVPTDISLLRKFYEETEQYECCQGIIEAYIDYEKLRRESDDDSESSSTSDESEFIREE